MTKILKESMDAQFLTFYNHEAIEEHLSKYKTICDVLDRNKIYIIEEKDKPLNEKKKTAYLLVLTNIMTRLFRIILTYHNERLFRIKKKYWETVANIPNDQLEFMSSSEKEFYRGYNDLVKSKLFALCFN
jgi:predicted site-specific integrase-resolvase